MHIICRRFSSVLPRGLTEKELGSLLLLNGGKKLPIRAHVPAAPPRPPDATTSEHRPLVMMVGWAESRQSTLSKYAAIYTDMGVPCVTVAASIRYMWFTSSGNRLTSATVASLDQCLDGPVSLLYHIFSGGGTAIFPQLLTEQAKPDSPLNTKLLPAGIVFDSGPAIFCRQSGLAASKLLYKQGAYNLLTYSLSNAIGLLTDAAIGQRKRAELDRALNDLQLLQLPQLYLHSTTDTVALHTTVQGTMEQQRSKGRSVSSHCWTDTEHVRHFSKHPQEYSEKIRDFVNNVIKNK